MTSEFPMSQTVTRAREMELPPHEPEACLAGSADFQSAVSPTSSRLDMGTTERARAGHPQRAGSPRYSRLEVCATDLRHNEAANSDGAQPSGRRNVALAAASCVSLDASDGRLSLATATVLRPEGRAPFAWGRFRPCSRPEAAFRESRCLPRGHCSLPIS